ncbi:MAG: hypothetical protein MAG794_00643 [Gammaproteobacteria bacterium]|nr:hypothetical protein [Gammaproteobacteria bacterium]
MKRIVLCASFIVSLVAVVAYGQTITKCQDEEGNWHYGDFAAEACAKESKITEIDERGVKVKESDAPLTQEELEVREAAEREQQREAERRARREAKNQRLLRTYDTAQDIVDAREEHLDALGRDLESYRLFRQDLVDAKEKLEDNETNREQIGDLQQRIKKYDAAIQSIENKRQATMEEYNKELKKFRELTDG